MAVNVILGLFIAGLGLAFPLWLVWRAYSTSRKLERGLLFGDPELLDSDQFKIDRVTLGPQGTQLIENVEFVMAPVQQQSVVQGGVDSDRIY
ncbi:hypothetical protein [Poseidonia sp.]|uniref:hypothetical protein n=1 Tax=Poseidonia sp. TaxID=2666344 RepID=UPI003F6A3F6D